MREPTVRWTRLGAGIFSHARLGTGHSRGIDAYSDSPCHAGTEMNTLHALAYVSRAANNIAPHHINCIVAEAAEFNVERGITGALVFDGAYFFQYIEGSRTALNEAYARIRGASSHAILMEYVDGPADARRFDGWSMFYREGQPSNIEQLNWMHGQGPVAPDFHRSVAMKALSYFWDQFPDERPNGDTC